jgi:hypothetical protein
MLLHSALLLGMLVLLLPAIDRHSLEFQWLPWARAEQYHQAGRREQLL